MQSLDSLYFAHFTQLLLAHHIDPLLLTRNGFDSWDLVLQLNMTILIELGLDPDESATVLSLAQQAKRKKPAVQEKSSPAKSDKENTNDPNMSGSNCLNQKWLLKGTSLKFEKDLATAKKLSQIRMVALERRQIDQIANLNLVKNLQILDLSENRISKIEGLQSCRKLKILKLTDNKLHRVEGLDFLCSLQQLNLSNNYIQSLDNIRATLPLKEIQINRQKIKVHFSFQPESLKNLPYLKSLECNYNKVRELNGFQYLESLENLSLRANEIQAVNSISPQLQALGRLRVADLREGLIVRSSKYRDYMVVLCNSLMELDGKNILAKQRQFLVNLFNLKYKKQLDSLKKGKQDSSEASMEMKGNKVASVQAGWEQKGHQALNSPKQFDGLKVHELTKNARG